MPYYHTEQAHHTSTHGRRLFLKIYSNLPSAVYGHTVSHMVILSVTQALRFRFSFIGQVCATNKEFDWILTLCFQSKTLKTYPIVKILKKNHKNERRVQNINIILSIQYNNTI